MICLDLIGYSFVRFLGFWENIVYLGVLSYVVRV